MTVYAFGEVLWDVYPDRKCIGGAPFNFAAHTARLGNEVYLLSAVGEDDLGDETLAAIREQGVKADAVTRSALPTGRCLVSLDAEGVPSYHLLENVAYDEISPALTVQQDGVLYFGTLALRSSHNRASLDALLRENSFREIFVDLNIRPPFSTVKAICFAVGHATVLKISEEELGAALSALGLEACSYRDAAFALKAQYQGLRLVLITRGGDGAYLYDAQTEMEYEAPAETVRVVSTVGAGDSFSAAFLSEYLRHRDPDKALAFAASLAAFVVSRKEAVPHYTLRDIM